MNTTTHALEDVSVVSKWRRGEDPDYLLSQEWLVTNGLGGYGSSTVRNIPTRRYHGLFIPNLPAPWGRTVLIPRIDETLQIDHRMIQLSGAERYAGDIVGQTHQYLNEFKLAWQMPVWTFEIEGRTFQKKIAMPWAQNTIYVEYKLIKGSSVRLFVRPYVGFRGHDGPLGHPTNWPFTVMLKKGLCEVHPSDNIAPLRMALKEPKGLFVSDFVEAEKIYYRVEKERGLECEDHNLSPGFFFAELAEHESVAFVASVETWDSFEWDAKTIFESEEHRLKHLINIAPAAAREGFPAQLVLAANQFIVFPATRPHERSIADAAGEPLRTIIAGYHWFTDWGRDTMISLEGLTLCTGRFEEAKAILQTFARYVKDGLIPNLFPEGQRTALYNTMDATLWYFHAIDRYIHITKDEEILHALYPTLESIIEWHKKGTHFDIGVDPNDGLLKGGQEGVALTWMDAKADDWVVTPRRGKPIEIQALWFNALRLMNEWSEKLGQPSKQYVAMADRTYASFNQRFWYSDGGYLYDVIDGDFPADASLRPNQLFSLSLRFPVLNPAQWEPMFNVVTKHLLTPFGLRSLAPTDKNYHSRYQGDRHARDSAYHQGMVWAWLIGPYIDAGRKIYRDPKDLAHCLADFEAHLAEAGMGSVSEIFDGDEPFMPRGCIAQAWSVAEVLRSYLSLNPAPPV